MKNAIILAIICIICYICTSCAAYITVLSLSEKQTSTASVTEIKSDAETIVYAAPKASATVAIAETTTETSTVELSTETTTADPTPYLDIPLSKELQKYTYKLSQEYNIDYFLIIAVIEQESTFRPTVISSGNYGLMQINRINHNWLSDTLGITDFLNPYQNIKAGTYMLSSLYNKYGTFSAALMAYNLGESGANRYWTQGIYSTTYSQQVLARRENLMSKTKG